MRKPHRCPTCRQLVIPPCQTENCPRQAFWMIERMNDITHDDSLLLCEECFAKHKPARGEVRTVRLDEANIDWSAK